MKFAVANTILGTPINRQHRAFVRRIRSIDVLYPAKIPRIAIVASVLYFWCRCARDRDGNPSGHRGRRSVCMVFLTKTATRV
jgi:hypothetical protein